MSLLLTLKKVWGITRVVKPATTDALPPSARPSQSSPAPLWPTMEAAANAWVQAVLNKVDSYMGLGIEKLTVDGIKGPKTTKAIMRYQELGKLSATGHVNSATAERMAATLLRIQKKGAAK